MTAPHWDGNWRDEYKQVVELDDETFMVQTGSAWMHVAATGTPIQTGAQAWA